MADGVFQLIDLESDYAFEFQYFPETVSTSSRANWNEQDTTMGVRPLFYANADPKRVSVRDAILDSTETNTSLQPDFELLSYFHSELEQGGVPTAILAVWGDQQLRCVMTELNIEQIMFSQEGNCQRAKVSFELIELQPDSENTTVEIGDDT
jgi:hypothetical protein